MYERVADLPLTIDSYDLELQERRTSSGFVRATTTVSLHGDGATGRSEDVTYDREDHVPFVGDFDADLAGEYTLDSFSDHLDDVDLWPEPATRSPSKHYRRWAFEAAALDLALRQADTDLASALDRSMDDVRFVVSTRIDVDEDGEEIAPSTGRVDAWLDVDPSLEFKLDPTPAWDDAIVEALAATDAVRILDLKGLYENDEVRPPADPDTYRRVLEGFPDAVVEDPRLTDETEAIVRGHEARISWDYPITGVESIEELPFEPHWLNIKPSRFSTVESLLDAIEYALENDVALYGGGQFELDVGRGQIQCLASLCYPDGPNDVAPGGYNDPEPAPDLPTSPLDVAGDSAGFGLH